MPLRQQNKSEGLQPLMKREEKIANDFLRAHFTCDPIYEPLGKSKPPDFAIGTTAFEVRRLNESFKHKDGRTEDLDQASYRLASAIRGELAKIDFHLEAGSFFWGLSFERPLPPRLGKTARELATKARAHYEGGSRTQESIVAGGISLKLAPASRSYGKAFLQGYESDGDSGGLIGTLYLQNIERTLKEKAEATRRFSNKFERWILVLVDSIMPGTRWTHELSTIQFDLQHFNGIIVLNPDGSLVFEWPIGCLNFTA
jgi:hypothetical protein